VFSVLNRLRELGAEIHFVDDGVGLSPRLWRNTIIDDSQVDIFLIRDSDSRLTQRDAIVVADWLRQKPESTAIFHCVRDHPFHSRVPVSAGLWGARRALLLRHFNDRHVKRYSVCRESYTSHGLYLLNVNNVVEIRTGSPPTKTLTQMELVNIGDY